MAKVYRFSALTGSDETCLDCFDGALLNNGDMAIVTSGGRIYFYRLDHDVSSDEVVPWIIRPNKNYGTKRWIIQNYSGIYSFVSTYRSADQSGYSSGVQAVQLDTEAFDVGGNFASYVYTCPVTGYYQVNFRVGAWCVGGNMTDFMGAVDNGAGTWRLRGSRVGSAGYGGIYGSNGSGLLYALVTSQFRLVMYSAITAGSITVGGGADVTYMDVRLVGI